jgi:hypothetical protein
MEVSMKTVFFAASLAISVAFLSCSGKDETESHSLCSGIAAKQSYEDDFDYESLDPSCISEQKKLIQIVEMHGRFNNPEEEHWDSLYSHVPEYVPGTGRFPELRGSNEIGWTYYVNDIAMTQEEYDEYQRKVSSIEKRDFDTKRDLPIPCVVGDYEVVWWAMLTDEEVAELEETYGELSIYDPSKMDYRSSSGVEADLPLSASSGCIW